MLHDAEPDMKKSDLNTRPSMSHLQIPPPTLSTVVHLHRAVRDLHHMRA